MDKYTVSCKSRKWSRKLWCYVLDGTRINSQTILAKNKGQDPRSSDSAKFIWNLAVQLVRPHVEQRRTLKSLTSAMRRSINYFLGVLGQENVDQNQNQVGEAEQVPAAENNLLPHPQSQEPAKRCDPCIKSIMGPGYCEKRKKVSATKVQCQRCANKLCPDHRVIICQECADSLEVRRERDNPDIE